jgi:glycosyltransferase involved in cell wall biosynthesis
MDFHQITWQWRSLFMRKPFEVIQELLRGNGMISVLMAIYDEPTDVYCRALKSIGGQTQLPRQVVLINDYPERKLDEAAIRDALGSDAIELLVINNTKNCGLGYSLNEGLKYCNQEYIARMDADDESLPERLQKQLDYMQKHPDVDFLFCDVIDSSRSAMDWTINADMPTFKKHFFKFFPFRHATLFAKSAPYKKTGYRCMGRSEDWDLYFRAKRIDVKEGFLADKLYLVNKMDKYNFRSKSMHMKRMAEGHILQAWLLTKNLDLLHNWDGFWCEYKIAIKRLPKMVAIIVYVVIKNCFRQTAI